MRKKLLVGSALSFIVFGVAFVLILTVNTDKAMDKIESGKYNVYLNDIPVKDLSGIVRESVVYASVHGDDADVYTDWKSLLQLNR